MREAHMPSRRLPLREAELFKSLGHPVRLQILWILAKEEACVCHLDARFRTRQAYLSQQLAVLREAGLVAERRMRPYVYYPARGPQLGELIDVERRFAGWANLGVPDPRRPARAHAASSWPNPWPRRHGDRAARLPPRARSIGDPDQGAGLGRAPAQRTIPQGHGQSARQP
jgi:ArsR family transcriptional regulator